MKSRAPLPRSTIALLALLALGAQSRAEAPAVPIAEAVAIAQKDLRDRGLDQEVYLSGVTLERESVASRKVHWFARWSSAIARPDRKKEIGLQIAMNGDVIRVIKAPAATAATRSNRASILDLRGH